MILFNKHFCYVCELDFLVKCYNIIRSVLAGFVFLCFCLYFIFHDVDYLRYTITFLGAMFFYYGLLLVHALMGCLVKSNIISAETNDMFCCNTHKITRTPGA